MCFVAAAARCARAAPPHARAWRSAGLCGLAVLLASCAWLDVRQREIVYRPTPGRPANFAGLRPGDVSFSVEVPAERPGRTDRLQMWWLPQPDPQAPTLLYLHGTFRNLYQNLPKIESLRLAGFAVLAVDYRGWGDSTPLVPSEATIYADANVAWQQLVLYQADPRKRVIYGHSMGSGVAVELASRRRVGTDYAALILESSFTTLPDVARVVGMAGQVAAWFATQQFDSLAKIGRVDAPVLMLHGTADRTVPIVLGRRLYRSAPPGTQWVEIEGGSHSSLNTDAPEPYQQALRELMRRIEAAP